MFDRQLSAAARQEIGKLQFVATTSLADVGDEATTAGDEHVLGLFGSVIDAQLHAVLHSAGVKDGVRRVIRIRKMSKKNSTVVLSWIRPGQKSEADKAFMLLVEEARYQTNAHR
mgnify:CR=1 FL=1|jgi:hypothetical protein|tara:strand:- start:213 stop:554 length:342 start_codon:yes stop_codon:yes gene_type:complete